MYARGDTPYQPGELFDADVKKAFGRFTTLRYLTANFNAETDYGVGAYQLSIRKGWRSSASRCLLHPAESSSWSRYRWNGSSAHFSAHH